MAKKWLSLRSLWTDVSEGNHSDALLGHLSESDLPDDLKLEVLALAAEYAAERKTDEAKIIGESTRGVESIAGGNGFETERSSNLLKLAEFFRSLKK